MTTKRFKANRRKMRERLNMQNYLNELRTQMVCSLIGWHMINKQSGGK